MRWLIAALLVLLPGASASAADNTQLRLQLLPADCIFDVVNDGSGDIIYITPEECGIEPDPTEPGAQPLTTTAPGDDLQTPGGFRRFLISQLPGSRSGEARVLQPSSGKPTRIDSPASPTAATTPSSVFVWWPLLWALIIVLVLLVLVWIKKRQDSDK